MSDRDSSDWERRLKNAHDCAQQGDIGDVTFLQASRHPLVSLFITTGDLTPNSPNKRSVSLSFVSQPSNYPSYIDDTTHLNVKGYNMFKEAVESNVLELDITPFKNISFHRYEMWLSDIHKNIDESIKMFQGVLCYINDQREEETHDSHFILHICDVMTIIYDSHNKTGTEVVVMSTLLSDLDNEIIVNELESTYLQASNRIFFLIHMDFLYMCYCYFGNNSFVPIRTKVKLGNNLLKESSFFTNEDHFVLHQIGKMKEINQNDRRLQTRTIYRTI